MSLCTMESLHQHSNHMTATTSDEDSGERTSSLLVNTTTTTSTNVTIQPQPQQQQQSSSDIDDADLLLISRVSAEIERMRTAPTTNLSSSNNNSTTATDRTYQTFPPYCLEMLKSIKGNHRCVDCGEQNPQWASYRYGALLCLKCSGHHRSLGVQISSVRSISMDEWNVTEVISMLEGGNSQLTAFFDRHNLTERTCPQPNHTASKHNNSKESKSSSLSSSSSVTINPTNVTRLRYKTKAALFYRTNMEKHINLILQSGPYQGREESRRIANNSNNTNNGSTS